MRLRADFLGDSDAREKLQGDLQEMQTLVKQGLALARGRDEIGKQRCQTDLHALIDSLVCDYSDAGELRSIFWRTRGDDSHAPAGLAPHHDQPDR